MLIESDSGRPQGEGTNYVLGKLSSSAQAILKTVRKLELGQSPKVFQGGEDLAELQRVVNSFKGGLYNSVIRGLTRTIERGGVQVITSSDLMLLIHELWKKNISRLTLTAMSIVEGSLKNPDLTIKQLSRKIGLSYSKTRRGVEQLRNSSVLSYASTLNLMHMGLDRILLTMDSCQTLPTSPYFTDYLFANNPSHSVLIKGLIPSKNRDAFLSTTKSLRSTSGSISAWALSRSEPNFSSAYHDKSSKHFEFDPLHFRLLLRAAGDELSLVPYSLNSIQFPKRFDSADARVIEALLHDFDLTLQEITKATGISESTAFRRRGKLVREKVVLPRTMVRIPTLSEYLVGIFSIETASKVISAWRALPLSYTSQITNLEPPHETRILLTAAVPRGSSTAVMKLITEEMSRLDEYNILRIDAGFSQVLPVSSLYDGFSNRWLFSPSFFDLRGYGSCRLDASAEKVQLDLT